MDEVSRATVIAAVVLGVLSGVGMTIGLFTGGWSATDDLLGPLS